MLDFCYIYESGYSLSQRAEINKRELMYKKTMLSSLLLIILY